MNAPARAIVAETVWPNETSRYKLRVDDYLLLDRAGSFHEARTELVDGDVIVMSPEWRPHLRVKSELAYRIRRAVEQFDLPYFVGIEGSVALSEHDMPQPDILLTSEIIGEGAVPRESIPLLIEVSSSTLDTDAVGKAKRYALGGIAEYWVIDVNREVVHQMWTPVDGEYTERCSIKFGDELIARTVAGLKMETAAL